MILTAHAKAAIIERGIKEEWLQRAIDDPDNRVVSEDGTVHYIKKIQEADDRILRVIVNPSFASLKIITAFFDRRIRRKA